MVREPRVRDSAGAAPAATQPARSYEMADMKPVGSGRLQGCHVGGGSPEEYILWLDVGQ